MSHCMGGMEWLNKLYEDKLALEKENQELREECEMLSASLKAEMASREMLAISNAKELPAARTLFEKIERLEKENQELRAKLAQWENSANRTHGGPNCISATEAFQLKERIVQLEELIAEKDKAINAVIEADRFESDENYTKVPEFTFEESVRNLVRVSLLSPDSLAKKIAAKERVIEAARKLHHYGHYWAGVDEVYNAVEALDAIGKDG